MGREDTLSAAASSSGTQEATQAAEDTGAQQQPTQGQQAVDIGPFGQPAATPSPLFPLLERALDRLKEYEEKEKKKENDNKWWRWESGWGGWGGSWRWESGWGGSADWRTEWKAEDLADPPNVMSGEREGDELRRTLREVLFEHQRKHDETFTQYVVRRHNQCEKAAAQGIVLPSAVKAILLEDGANLSGQEEQNLRTMTGAELDERKVATALRNLDVAREKPRPT